MTPIEIIVDALGRNLGMLKSTIADFSDSELLVRPVPGANHAAWQIGHLISSEARMINGIAPGTVTLPEGFDSRFDKSKSTVDDAGAFPPKAELLATYEAMRGTMVEWAKGLTAEDLSKPAPEKMQRMCPTVGHVLTMIPVHAAMHIGQFQVIRRKLGKPILF